MSTNDFRPGGLRLPSFLVMVPLLAGCAGGAGPMMSSSPDATPPGHGATATATASSTGSPAASIASRSTEDRLHWALSAGLPWQVTATLEGTIGGAKGTVTGTVAVRGDDFSLALVRTLGGEPTGVRQLVIGGWSYVKYKDQAWQLVPQDDAHPRPRSLRTALMTVDCTEPQPGTLVMTGDDAATVVEALGMVDPGTTDIDAEATMTLRPDGNPNRLRVGFDSAIGRWDVAYAFDASATVEPLTAPEDPVAVWEQSAAFRIMYPMGWEVESIGLAPEIIDMFASPPNGIVTVYCVPTSFSHKEWVADGVRGYTKLWDAKPTDSWSDTVGANIWSFSDWEKATFVGDHGTAMVAATIHDGLGCDVTVFVFSSGDRETLMPEFGRVVASFTFLN